MKTTVNFCLAACAIAAVASCSKYNDDPIIDNSRVMTFEVPDFYLGSPEDAFSKVYDTEVSNHHYFHWEQGDEIAIFTYQGTGTNGKPTSPDDKTVSTLGKFTATSVVNKGTSTSAVFSANVAADIPLYKYAYAIYPYKESFKTAESTSQGFKISCNIPEVQNGNALDYIYLTSRDIPVTVDSKTGKASFGAFPKFVLATPITIFRVSSIKPITKIEIDGGETVKNFTGNGYFRTNAGTVYDRGTSTKLTIEKGGEVVVPADEETELSFAARQFEASGKVADIAITFTFTADDDTKCTKIYKPNKAQSANTIINLGTITLEKFE